MKVSRLLSHWDFGAASRRFQLQIVASITTRHGKGSGIEVVHGDTIKQWFVKFFVVLSWSLKSLVGVQFYLRLWFAELDYLGVLSTELHRLLLERLIVNKLHSFLCSALSLRLLCSGYGAEYVLETPSFTHCWRPSTNILVRRMTAAMLSLLEHQKQFHLSASLSIYSPRKALPSLNETSICLACQMQVRRTLGATSMESAIKKYFCPAHSAEIILASFLEKLGAGVRFE